MSHVREISCKICYLQNRVASDLGFTPQPEQNVHMSRTDSHLLVPLRSFPMPTWNAKAGRPTTASAHCHVRTPVPTPLAAAVA